MKLDNEILKKRLRYQGEQYSAGSAARGGSGDLHILTQAADRLDELETAIARAYGYLWHVNNEPGTPNRYSPEKAAYEARKLLRDLMTHEQRGIAIKKVREALTPND
jgi:hypothetical protein